MRVVPDSSERAAWEGRKSSSSIAFFTRSSVAGETEPFPLTTREAVPSPTPARRATSLIVATESLDRLPVLIVSKAYCNRASMHRLLSAPALPREGRDAARRHRVGEA